ncbi:hypothetical protein PVAP13_7NG406800 [Panicum virgatum]|uniref:Uncharacterized protein n=1 Tax=Panicum virgatum TaxID=38727 RepID=A0A8T0Q181_PANVG|nr:hypothetical protein PVAP13_7NG406800 [Panicum virgatum]
MEGIEEGRAECTCSLRGGADGWASPYLTEIANRRFCEVRCACVFN